MHTVTLEIENNIYQNIMFLLNNLKLDGLKIKEENKDISDEGLHYKDWSKDELKNIGKIGFDSKSFIEDSEDYSKW